MHFYFWMHAEFREIAKTKFKLESGQSTLKIDNFRKFSFLLDFEYFCLSGHPGLIDF